MNRNILAFIFAILLSLSDADAAEGNFDINFGIREDRLSWNKAHPSGTPNILSELTWSGLKIAEISVNGDVTAANGFHLRGSLAYGEIYDGKNQDSDYLGDDRTLEFSRSNNDTKDDDVLDLSLALGYRFRVAEDAAQRSTYVIPLVGYSYHEQNLRITNGFQTIPAAGAFPGLNSTYQTEWKGPWVGVELLVEGRKNINGYLRLEYHKADYYAQANWNLRPDLQHPKSFEHDADGDGRLFSIGFYSAKKKGWGFKFSFDYQKWTTDPGIDRMFFATGTITEMRLNEVEWKSSSINLGLRRMF